MTSDSTYHEVKRKILQLRDSLRPSERRVADVFLREPEAFAMQNISKVAQYTGTSDATVARFATAVGFDGFLSLKRALRDDLYQNRTLKKLGAISDEPVNSPFRDALETDIHSVNTMLEDIDRKSIDHVVDLLLDSKAIYALGLRASHRLASLAARNFHLLLHKGRLLRADEGELEDQAILLAPEDVLIAFCFPRYTRATQNFLRLAQARNTRIVLVTDSPLAPGSDLATVVLPVKITSPTPLYSYVAGMSLINGLTAEVSHRGHATVNASLAAWEGLITDAETFVE